jgi:aconitate hydratase
MLVTALNPVIGYDTRRIAFTPARVLLQDFTGVPAVVDLAAMRDAMAAGRRPQPINPLSAGELVIDHSVQVDVFGTRRAGTNAKIEFERNQRALRFLRWGQKAFATSAWCRRTPASCTRSTSSTWRAWSWRRTAAPAYPDTLVGTDSHTTMINGWACWAGAWAASRPRPRCSASRSAMLIPQVVGFR